MNFSPSSEPSLLKSAVLFDASRDLESQAVGEKTDMCERNNIGRDLVRNDIVVSCGFFLAVPLASPNDWLGLAC